MMRKVIVYEEQDSFYERLKKVKRSVKELLRYLKRNICKNNNSFELLEFKQANMLINKSEEEFVIINRIPNKHYVCYDSRVAKKICFDNSGSGVMLYNQSIKSTHNKEILFSVFLGSNVRNIQFLKIKGFYETYYLENTHKYPFSVELDDIFLKELREPTFWIDIKLDIPEFEEKEADNISLFLEDISVEKHRTNQNKITNYFISNINPCSPNDNNNRLILVLSLDAISYIDIAMNSTERDSKLSGIKKFENESVSYNRACSSSSLTASSAASLITGLGLSRHCLYDYDLNTEDKHLKVLSLKYKTIGEILRANEYKCFGLTSFSRWRPHFGYSKGFDSYINVSTGNCHTYPYIEKSLSFIKNSIKSPTFVLLHLIGGHPPLLPKYDYNDNDSIESAYLNTIEEADQTVRAIFNYIRELGIYDSSLIFLVSDHGGRPIAQHEGRRGYQFYEDRLRVPFMVKFPKDCSAQSKWEGYVNKPISATTSIYETITDVTGIQRPDYFNNLSRRTYNEVTWVSEAVDYSTSPVKRLGIVGYDNQYKWVLFFHFNHLTCEIGEHSECVVNPLYNNYYYANDDQNKINTVNKERLESVIEDAREYLNVGLAFVSKYPPAIQSNNSLYSYYL